MLAFRFHFPARRYHATPWGHHVNEGEVEWPPALWRLSRALIAVWHRKLDPTLYPEERLEELLAILAGEAPVYRLPSATHAHTRHYMPGRSYGPKPKDRDMVFDAFARVHSDEALIMAWPQLEIEDDLVPLLDELLQKLGYLGRAESWIEAERIPDWPGWEDRINCQPGDKNVDHETGEVLGEVVTLYRPRTPDDYAAFREEVLTRLEGLDLSSRERKRVKATVPERWLDALRIETSELQRAGWDRPPAASIETYVRPDDALRPPPRIPRRSTASRPTPTTARFAMYGKPLPRLEDAVKIGEVFRAAVMSNAKNIFGADSIPPLLSGHDLPDDNVHGHAFYLPEDGDGDGRIDHLVVHVPEGLSRDACKALDSLNRLWTREGYEWKLVLEGIGKAGRFVEICTLIGTGRTWRSLSPYLHPWHVKKHFAVEDQIRRECRLRDLPEIQDLTSFQEIAVGGRPRRPVHFRRIRSRRGLTQPDTRGSFWEIAFREPVVGPLALGFSCHFGLGLFRARDRPDG